MLSFVATSAGGVALGVGVFEDLVCILILMLRRAPLDEETDTVDVDDDEGGGAREMGFDG